MKLRTSLCAVAVVALIVLPLGCGLDPGGAWNRTDGAGPYTGSASGGPRPDDDSFESFATTCPATSPRFPGTKGPGVACAAASECSPTCCACPVEPQTWLASSCVAGACADGMTACGRTQASNCSAGAPIIIGGGGVSSLSACDSCIQTSCFSPQAACNANTACTALETCDAQCASDAACREGCYETHAAGAADLQSLDACVANACGAACVP